MADRAQYIDLFIEAKTNSECGRLWVPKALADRETIQRLLATAPRIAVHETNILTDPLTYDTAFVLQSRNHPPMVFKATLEDWEELNERRALALFKAGYRDA